MLLVWPAMWHIFKCKKYSQQFYFLHIFYKHMCIIKYIKLCSMPTINVTEKKRKQPRKIIRQFVVYQENRIQPQPLRMTQRNSNRSQTWMCIKIHLERKWKWSHSVVSNSLGPRGLQSSMLLHAWDFPGKNTGVGCHFLLQRIFLTQGWNLGLPHCKMLYRLSHQRSTNSPGELGKMPTVSNPWDSDSVKLKLWSGIFLFSNTEDFD